MGHDWDRGGWVRIFSVSETSWNVHRFPANLPNLLVASWTSRVFGSEWINAPSTNVVNNASFTSTPSTRRLRNLNRWLYGFQALRIFVDGLSPNELGIELQALLQPFGGYRAVLSFQQARVGLTHSRAFLQITGIILSHLTQSIHAQLHLRFKFEYFGLEWVTFPFMSFGGSNYSHGFTYSGHTIEYR